MSDRTIRFSYLFAGVGLMAFALMVVGMASEAIAAEQPAAAPAHQVIACYFHRTVRCPTCQKISAYIEESVNAGYAQQIKDGGVKVVMIDFQDAKNQNFTKAYRITGPTLVLMNVKDGKVAEWKAAPKVWSLVGQKDQFVKYVQGEVRSYLDEKAAAR